MNQSVSAPAPAGTGSKLPLRYSLAWLLLALLAGASTWFYTDYVLKPLQISDAHTHDRPRGNLSDLYPRWLGTRELLVNGRNPYSRAITLEIQKGYYGRELDPAKPDDPKDQQAFAYPVYVVFLLAPLIALPFHVAQILMYWGLIALTAASVPLWLNVLRWRVSLPGVLACIALTLGSFPAVQGFKLQQLTLLVAGLLTIAVYCITRGWNFAGGATLALATIKPQLSWLLVGWILLWALSGWKSRRNVILSFVAVMALFLIGAEVVLPGWLAMFLHAMRDYRQYTQSLSVLDELVGTAIGRTVAAVAVVLAFAVLWPTRKTGGGDAFPSSVCLVLALTILVVPTFSPYNQVLLLGPVLWLTREVRTLCKHSRLSRAVIAACALAVLWPWIATLALTAAKLGFQEKVMQFWRSPLYSTFSIPILVFTATLLGTLLERTGLSSSERPVTVAES